MKRFIANPWGLTVVGAMSLSMCVVVASGCAWTAQAQTPAGGAQHPAPTPISPVAANQLIPPGVTLERPKPGDEPKVIFKVTEADLGGIDDGGEKAFDFNFKNEGPGPLKILNVRPACSCTSGGVTVDGKAYSLGDPIAKGASGTIRAVLKANGWFGEKHSELAVLTNDPNVPPSAETPFGHVTLKVRAKAIKPFEIEEGTMVDFGSVRRGAMDERVVHLKSNHDLPFQVVDFQGRDAKAEWTAEACNEKATRWLVKVKISPNVPYGVFGANVNIVTNHSELQPVPLTIRANIRGAVSFDPMQGVSFRVVPSGQEPKVPLKIKVDAGLGQLKISNVTLADPRDFSMVVGMYQIKPNATLRPVEPKWAPHLTTSVKETTPGSEAEIEIGLKSTMPVGSFSAMLTFETGIPDGPARISVPVTGFVK